VPMLVAVTVCEPVVPTTVATETLVGVTTSVAEADCESGLEFAAEETTPTQPEAQMHPAKKADRNTRTAPRFTRKEFTWIFFLRLNFIFCGGARVRFAAQAKAGADKSQGARMLVSNGQSSNLYEGQFPGMGWTVPVLCC
jgi:hypothetical protein